MYVNLIACRTTANQLVMHCFCKEKPARAYSMAYLVAVGCNCCAYAQGVGSAVLQLIAAPLTLSAIVHQLNLVGRELHWTLPCLLLHLQAALLSNKSAPTYGHAHIQDPRWATEASPATSSLSSLQKSYSPSSSSCRRWINSD